MTPPVEPRALASYRDNWGFQQFGKLVREFWGLELALADEKGYVIDHADGKIVPSQNEFCRRALFSKEGFKRCNDSVAVLADRLASDLKKPKETESTATVHQCHLGFELVGHPVVVENSTLGFVFAGGGVRQNKKINQQELIQRLRDFSEVTLGNPQKMIDEIPALSEGDISKLSGLVKAAAEWVGRAFKEQSATGLHEIPSSNKAADPKIASPFPEIVGTCPSMQKVYSLLKKIVRSESTVLIHGESGTGKELIARAIHYHGPRADKPFVVQNCSAFNDNLLESALFGHVRGSFTGAVKDQKGLFEVADGGTFFLDEIGDMSASLQVKLLRVLQEGTLTPVGATKQSTVDVRIIAASHKDLTKMVEEGRFREDLYYRVNVLRVDVPPLRDRHEDLEELISFFLQKHYKGEDDPPRLSIEAMELFKKYPWPGNIRELENEMERLNVLAGGSKLLPLELLSPRLLAATEKLEAAAKVGGAPQKNGKNGAEKISTLKEIIERVEAEAIKQGLIRTHWNKSQLAKDLGISRSNLIQKCSHYGLDRKD